jgi:hypothetical protein
MPLRRRCRRLPHLAIALAAGIGSALTEVTKRESQLDFTVLNRGEKIAGVAGILLILIMFIFDWFGLGISGTVQGISFPEVTSNAWGSYGFTDIVLFVTALAAIALALTAASDAEVGLPVALSAIVTALGILSLILVIISIISPPDFGAPDVSGLDHSRKIGVWLGLIAVAAVTIGGFLAMQEEGTSFADEAERFRGGGTGTGTGGPGAGPPAPPPPSSSPPPPPSSPPPGSNPPPSGGP